MGPEEGGTPCGNFLGFGARDMGSHLTLTDDVVCVNSLTLLCFLFIIFSAGEKTSLTETEKLSV